MKITVVNGTNREGNRSMEISEEVIQVGEKMDYQMALVTLENWDKLFRGDYVKLSNASEGQKEDIEKMIGADMLLFVVPTYHHGIPSPLKNFLDSLKSKSAYDKKVIGLISSNSRDGDQGATQAKQVIDGIISYEGAQSTIVPKITIINYKDINKDRIKSFIEYCVGVVK